jgi:hypothetical protein
MMLGERKSREAHTDACRRRFSELWEQDESPLAQEKNEKDKKRRLD